MEVARPPALTVAALDAPTFYVKQGGSDGNVGLSWKRAFATVQEAIANVPVGIGAKIEIGDGEFASFHIDGSTVLMAGLVFRGRGPYATTITSGSDEEDAIAITAGASPAFLSFEDLGMTGSRDGLNLGNGLWEQIGPIRTDNVWSHDNARDGIRIYNINNSLFSHTECRDNGERGYRVTTNIADGSGTLLRGNTTTFVNCPTIGNTDGGWLFDQPGNSYTIIGGENDTHPSNKYAVEIRPGTSLRNIKFLGVHFERNWRACLIGDHNATGSARTISFDSCFFALQTGAYDVVIDGSEAVEFKTCGFGGSHANYVANIKLQGGVGGSHDRVRLTDCIPVSNVPILEDASGVLHTTLKGSWGQGDRRRIVNIHSSAADSIPAIDYIKNTVADVPWRRMEHATGGAEDWVGAGSPEGVITAPVGSMYRRTNGGAGTALYVKESGSGNTGWGALSFDSSLATKTEVRSGVPTADKRLNMPRWAARDNISPLSSGRISAFLIGLEAGTEYSGVKFTALTTPLSGGIHQWAALFNASRQLLAISADLTSTAWVTSGTQTFTFTVPYTPASTGDYYVGLMVSASTPPSLYGMSAPGTAVLQKPLIASGFDGTNVGLTDPASCPATLAGLTTQALTAFVEVF